MAMHYPLYRDNWYIQMKMFFTAIDRERVWPDLPYVSLDVSNLTYLYKNYLSKIDINRKRDSCNLCIYSLLSTPDNYDTPLYLNLFRSLHVMRTLAQFRLKKIFNKSIFINREFIDFNYTDLCCR